MKRQFLTYGVVLALSAFVLNWIEYNYLVRAYPNAILQVLLALVFMALGVWIGAWLVAKPVSKRPQSSVVAHISLGITNREFQVLELLARGQSNKEMAHHLGVSPNTIKSHLSRLFDKLDVQRRTQAIARARALELIR